jgi:hypothetical protein
MKLVEIPLPAPKAGGRSAQKKDAAVRQHLTGRFGKLTAFTRSPAHPPTPSTSVRWRRLPAFYPSNGATQYGGTRPGVDANSPVGTLDRYVAVGVGVGVLTERFLRCIPGYGRESRPG